MTAHYKGQVGGVRGVVGEVRGVVGGVRAGHPQVCGKMDLHDPPTDMTTGMPTNRQGHWTGSLPGSAVHEHKLV